MDSHMGYEQEKRYEDLRETIKHLICMDQGGIMQQHIIQGGMNLSSCTGKGRPIHVVSKNRGQLGVLILL